MKRARVEQSQHGSLRGGGGVGLKIKAQIEKPVKMYSSGGGGALLRAPSALLPVYLNSLLLHAKLPWCRPETANGTLDGVQ